MHRCVWVVQHFLSMCYLEQVKMVKELFVVIKQMTVVLISIAPVLSDLFQCQFCRVYLDPCRHGTRALVRSQHALLSTTLKVVASVLCMFSPLQH